jgi:Protein of unknown function (DUF2846)
MTRTITLGVLALTLAACSSSTPPAPAPTPAPAAVSAPAPAPAPAAVTADHSGKATIYIYRPKAFMGTALRPTVMVDGKDLVNIGNGRVYAGYFMPGKYLFQMDDKKSGAELDLKPGDTYYFRVEIVPGFWKGGGRMTLMDAKQGSVEIQGLTPVEAKEIEDKTRT